MKNLITTLLLIEMILLPFPNNGMISQSIADDSETECSNGQVFDTSLNRCVLSTQTVEDKTNARNCEGLDEDAYKECFNKNVEKEMAEAEADGEIKGKSDPEKKYGIPAVVTIGSAYVLFRNKESLGQCSSTSMWLMLGGGVSSLLGEYMAQNSYKKKLNGMTEEYKDRMSEKPLDDLEVVASINENQKIAFEFQIEQEKARKAAHDARNKAYMLAMGLYSASAVAAAYEGFTGNWTSCSTSSISPPRHKSETLFIADSSLIKNHYYIDSFTSSEITELVLRSLSDIFIPTAQAAGEMEVITVIGKRPPPINVAPPSIPPTTGVEANISNIASKSGSGKAMNKAFMSPIARAAMGAILAIYSKKVAGDAADLANEASERIALLEELKASFEANGGAGFGYCSDEDRKSTSKPACYCFLSDGNRDPSKKNSGICAGVYGEASKLSKTDYGKNNQISEQGVKGCFTKTKQFDPECKCKARTDSGGNDACLRINGKLKLGSLGSVTGLKDMMKDTVAFTQGDISTAQLDSGSTENLALNLDKIKKNLLKKPKFKKQNDKINLAQKKLKKQLSNLSRKGLSSGSISNPFGAGLNSAINPISPKEVLKNMANSIKENKAKFQRGGTLSGGKKRPALGDYDFGGSAKNKAGVSVDDIDGLMKKEYSFNDINENPDNSIFKIITNRYQRSGLRRLFDEKGISKADGANDTDINAK